MLLWPLGKVVNGKLKRLPGDGWREALELDVMQKDDLYAGRAPRTSGEGLTAGELRGRFLTAKCWALDAGWINARFVRNTGRLPTG